MNDAMRLLEGKKIVIVGGGGLLGASICKALVAYGAIITIADVSVERSSKVAEEINSEFGSRPSVCEMSIIDEKSVLQAISASDEAMNGIDGLINTAYPRNKNYGRKFEDVTYADFCENTNLHLGGYFLVSQKILEYFKGRGGGSLLNISSIYGVIAPRFDVYEGTPMTMPVEYAAIKAGLIHLTKYMAKYYAGNRIRVNSLSLGGLLDNQPKDFVDKYRAYSLDKGMLDPKDIIGSIGFLLSDLAEYVNGQNLIVDDGWTL